MSESQKNCKAVEWFGGLRFLKLTLVFFRYSFGIQKLEVILQSPMNFRKCAIRRVYLEMLALVPSRYLHRLFLLFYHFESFECGHYGALP